MTEKLTREMIVQGEVDVEAVTMAEIAAFAEEELGVPLRKGISKREALNLVVDAIEAPPALPETEEEQPPDEEATPEEPAPDLGAAYLNRRADTIKAQQGVAASLKIDIEEQAKKSAYIARRLKSKA